MCNEVFKLTAQMLVHMHKQNREKKKKEGKKEEKY